MVGTTNYHSSGVLTMTAVVRFSIHLITYLVVLPSTSSGSDSDETRWTDTCRVLMSGRFRSNNDSFFSTWLAQWGLYHVQVTAQYPVSLFALAVVASLSLLEEIADQIYLKIIPGLLPCTYPHLARQTKTRGGLKHGSSARMTGEGRKQCQAKNHSANPLLTSL